MNLNLAHKLEEQKGSIFFGGLPAYLERQVFGWADKSPDDVGRRVLVRCPEFPFPVMAVETPNGSWFAPAHDAKVTPTEFYRP